MIPPTTKPRYATTRSAISSIERSAWMSSRLPENVIRRTRLVIAKPARLDRTDCSLRAVSARSSVDRLGTGGAPQWVTRATTAPVSSATARKPSRAAIAGSEDAGLDDEEDERA